MKEEIKQLLKDLATDLSEINMNKRGHVQVDNIIAHYMKRIEELEE